ncbi:MAG: cbb3-type cytochrome c oxidase N-terminal domain-containing protein [Ignavibacteriaceae bacterium]
MKITLFTFILLILNTNLFAEGESDFPPNYYDIIAISLMLVVVLTFLGLIYFEQKKETTEKKEIPLFAKLRHLLTLSTPIEKEKDILFDHEYDGIKELDSRIPPWFTGLFWVTILFAVYYMLNFHVLNTGKLMYEEYEEEMKIALLQKEELMASGAFLTEQSVTQLTDDVALLAGKNIFEANCVACHLADGGGLVGPNLTDEYWIHGGGIKNIFHTIKYGVPEKGMISWQRQLNPIEIQEVASYVMSLQGTHPAVPKPPQGEIWTEPAPDKKDDQINL